MALTVGQQQAAARIARRNQNAAGVAAGTSYSAPSAGGASAPVSRPIIDTAPAPTTPKVGDIIPGTSLKYEQSDIDNLAPGGGASSLTNQGTEQRADGLYIDGQKVLSKLEATFGPDQKDQEAGSAVYEAAIKQGIPFADVGNYSFSNGTLTATPDAKTSAPTINRTVLSGSGSQNSLTGANTTGGGVDGVDYRTQAEKDAEDYLNKGLTVPKTEDQIIAERTAQSKGLITSLEDLYTSKLKSQEEVNKQRTAETNAQSVLSGLMGSSEAGNRAIVATEKNSAANNAILTEKAAKLQEIYTNIQNDSRTEAKAQRDEARMTAKDILDRAEQKRTKAVENVKILAGAGFDLSAIKSQDPATYAGLVKSIGNEKQLESLFVINRPKNDIVGTPIRVGDHYVQMYKNPLTGKITAENVELPGGLPANYTKFEKIKDAAGNETLIAIPDNWDGNPASLKKVGGGNGTPTTTGTGNGAQYAAVVDTILASGKFTAAQAAAVKNGINNGEDPLTVVKNQAKSILGTEGTTVTKLENALNSTMNLQTALKEYYDAKGDTGIFKGNFEKVMNNLGAVNDPGLVDIAVKIAAALQKYRNSISGTAYSEQEGKDIASIFPGITKGEILNNTIVKARLQTLDSDIDGAYRNAIGSAYDKLKAIETSKSATTLTSPDGKSFVNKSDLTPAQLKEAEAAGWK